jgi:hypothetical protein
MWRMGTLFVSLFAAAGCATADYRAEPNGPNVYTLYLTTHRSDRLQRHAELARRAAALCETPYQLNFESERVTLCTDDCELSETSVATLSCESGAAKG